MFTVVQMTIDWIAKVQSFSTHISSYHGRCSNIHCQMLGAAEKECKHLPQRSFEDFVADLGLDLVNSFSVNK